MKHDIPTEPHPLIGAFILSSVFVLAQIMLVIAYVLINPNYSKAYGYATVALCKSNCKEIAVYKDNNLRTANTGEPLHGYPSVPTPDFALDHSEEIQNGGDFYTNPLVFSGGLNGGRGK